MQQACLQVRQSCSVARHGLHCLRNEQHHDFSSAQVSMKSQSPLWLKRSPNDHMLLSFSDYSTERQKLAPFLTLLRLSLIGPSTPIAATGKSTDAHRKRQEQSTPKNWPLSFRHCGKGCPDRKPQQKRQPSWSRHLIRMASKPSHPPRMNESNDRA